MPRQNLPLYWGQMIWKHCWRLAWSYQLDLHETLRKSHKEYPHWTNLNAGIGNPWAGHSKVTSLFCTRVIPLKLMSSGNLGFALPIGSTNIKNEMTQRDQSNLNAGKGNPWAGQRSVSWLSTALVMLLEFTSSENLGLELPIGSRKNIHSLC